MSKNFKNKKVKAIQRITNTNKGITLIALIITIIVLLILAVVAIRAVQGEGILAHAKKARDEYQEAQGNEATILQEYEDYITEQSGKSYPKVKVGEKAETNGTINGKAPNANNPIIPAGFAPINVAGTEPSNWNAAKGPEVGKGLVISDATEEGAGNEFVWIPVADVNKMVICQASNRTDENHKIDPTTLKCNTCGDNTKLAGRLYATTAGETTFNATLADQKYQKNSGFREPDLVTDCDNKDNSSTLDAEQIQTDFNNMVKSVAKYGGFYVGRYEMSLTEDGTTAQSKKGTKENQVLSATAEESSANMWYGLYSKAKTYSEKNSGLGITSEMIWGCQYDAMMLWMNDNGKTSEITDTSVTKKNTTQNTGSVETDKINNVYDLYGNRLEWTQEASTTYLRVHRGGHYDSSRSPSYRFYYGPTNANGSGYYGTRLSLYVK